jgi:thymidylate synthase ThyX
MIEANIICDSVNVAGDRLTTFILKYPRFVHSEMLTHRSFSRNASSSRARPITKVIEEAELFPAMPIFWGKNQKGMQSFEELDEKSKEEAIKEWDVARMEAVKAAKRLNAIGLHKQYVNRILEPFTHITVICTATEYNNFFNLRAHPDAQPEIQKLAELMLDCYLSHHPKTLKPGEWHLPFCDKFTEQYTEEELKTVCVARCARVSYLNFAGNISYQDDLKLFNDLIRGGHWSPFEHAAKALDKSDRCGNIVGYQQYRKLFANENLTKLSERLNKRKKC